MESKNKVNIFHFRFIIFNLFLSSFMFHSQLIKYFILQFSLVITPVVFRLCSLWHIMAHSCKWLFYITMLSTVIRLRNDTEEEHEGVPKIFWFNATYLNTKFHPLRSDRTSKWGFKYRKIYISVINWIFGTKTTVTFVFRNLKPHFEVFLGVQLCFKVSCVESTYFWSSYMPLFCVDSYAKDPLHVTETVKLSSLSNCFKSFCKNSTWLFAFALIIREIKTGIFQKSEILKQRNIFISKHIWKATLT